MTNNLLVSVVRETTHSVFLGASRRISNWWRNNHAQYVKLCKYKGECVINTNPTFSIAQFNSLMEVMDACMNGRFVHMGVGYYIIDRNGNDVIIDFDGTRTPAPVHQEGRNNMGMYYSIRARLMSADMKDSYESMYRKSHTEQWMEEARKKGRILHTNGAYTVIFNGQSVVWIYSDSTASINYDQHLARHGYVLVRIMDKVDSWKYLQANSMHSMAKELETFSW